MSSIIYLWSEVKPEMAEIKRSYETWGGSAPFQNPICFFNTFDATLDGSLFVLFKQNIVMYDAFHVVIIQSEL